MSVDYSGVGGVGISVENYLEVFLKNEEFQELWDNSNEDAVNWLIQDCPEAYYDTAGTAYRSGGERFYILIEGDTLYKVMNNCDKFMAFFKNKWEIDLSWSKLKIISDYYVY